MTTGKNVYFSKKAGPRKNVCLNLPSKRFALCLQIIDQKFETTQKEYYSKKSICMQKA